MQMSVAGRSIGERIRAAREAKGWTQQELATRSGLSYSVVARIEQNRKADPRISTLRALAKALGLTLNDLDAEEA